MNNDSKMSAELEKIIKELYHDVIHEMLNGADENADPDTIIQIFDEEIGSLINRDMKSLSSGNEDKTRDVDYSIK